MEKKEIRVEAPSTVAGITLVPIVRSLIGTWHDKGRLLSFGLKQPVSVLVISPQGRRAFRIDGEEITMNDLAREVPGIEEILDSICSP